MSAPDATSAAQVQQAPPLTNDGNVFNPNTGTGTTYVVSGQLLPPGGTIYIDSTTILLAPSATALIINSQMTPLGAPAIVTNEPVLTIGGSTITALPSGGVTYVIDGQTQTPDGVVTVSGRTISLSPSATALVIDSQTTTLFPATAASFTTEPVTATTAAPGSTGDDGGGPAATASTSAAGASRSTPSVSDVGFVSSVAALVVSFLGASGVFL